MRHQVSEQARAIWKILAPAVKCLGAKRHLLFHWLLPAIPIDVLSRGLLLDRIIPFTASAITAIVSLAPNQCADLTALNYFSALVPAAGRTTLRADLENLA